MITVFYDGKCGLCTREIEFFKRRTPRHSVLFRDIARDPAALEGRNITQAEALMLMHVEDNTGRIHLGVEAFVLLWSQYRGWSLLAKFVSLPVIAPVSRRLYRYFARRRFEGHAHCRVAAEAEGKAAEELLAPLRSQLSGHATGVILSTSSKSSGDK
ncbi:thiol-disulfide oxidoreductase [Roseibium aquae]|uniref:Thiol-disulfide oxidoreductase n=1 Tax=Roseibium aquae TaxID=1323746 RepID=A0A916WYB7_9HYPH|nr:DUF393 domain-containing protein [Roseibium aquae]GGB39347.1 thiol-disulfide oxidoreductase [Roseibium aquae]